MAQCTDEQDGVVKDDELIEVRPPAIGTETYKDVRISEDLTPQQQKEVRSLLREFKDVFSDKPGTTKLIEHEIETTTKDPIRVRPYPMP